MSITSSSLDFSESFFKALRIIFSLRAMAIAQVKTDTINDAQSAGVPVFMKDNLKKVYGDNLLREHPEGMVWPEEGHR